MEDGKLKKRDSGAFDLLKQTKDFDGGLRIQTTNLIATFSLFHKKSLNWCSDVVDRWVQ